MSLQGVDYEARCMRLEAEVQVQMDRVRNKEARIEAALALHKEQVWSGRCEACERAWPCPTVKALKGE